MCCARRLGIAPDNSICLPNIALSFCSFLRNGYVYGAGFLTWAALPDELNLWSAVLRNQCDVIDAEIAARPLATSANGLLARPYDTPSSRTDAWSNMAVQFPETALFGGQLAQRDSRAVSDATPFVGDSATAEPALWGDDSLIGNMDGGAGSNSDEVPIAFGTDASVEASQSPATTIRRRRK